MGASATAMRLASLIDQSRTVRVVEARGGGEAGSAAGHRSLAAPCRFASAATLLVAPSSVASSAARNDSSVYEFHAL
eukprot:6203351-Pleurochrysis_carterae.AAC.6